MSVFRSKHFYVFLFVFGGICSQPLIAQTSIERKYFASGQVRELIPLVDGKVHGVMMTYYESGQVRREIPHTNVTVA